MFVANAVLCCILLLTLILSMRKVYMQINTLRLIQAFIGVINLEI
ncbi:hypothetical protein [Fusobacterium sp. PH5-44]